MKRLLLLGILMLGINSSGREYHPIVLSADMISVYFDSLAVYEVCKLDNTRSHENLDWCYHTIVDNQTQTMFHICTVMLADFIFESCKIEGWVKKEDCSVGFQVDNYDNNGGQWKFLYEKPDINSPKDLIIIPKGSIIDVENSLRVEEIDLQSESRWIKICFEFNGVKYYGWTERYIIDV